MRLLIIADNGFSESGKRHYYSLPNHVYSEQYRKFFGEVLFLARKDNHLDNDLEIPLNEKVFLVQKNNFIELKKTMIEHKDEYDAVLARNGINGCVLARTAKSLGKILIAYCGSDPFSAQLAKGGFRNFFKGLIWFLLEKRKMKIADYAHYCTEYLQKRYPCRCPYLICSNVNISIDDDTLINRMTYIETDKQKYVIGLMGVVDSKLKGVDCAIKALSLLNDEYELELVGDGDFSTWNDLISSLNLNQRIRYLGYFSDKNRIMEWFERIDCYIQPSLSEGLPRSMIEAMSRACPVIATDISDIPNLLDECALIKKNDYRELAGKIKRMHDDVSYAKKQAKKNFDTSKKFSCEIRNEKLSKFYNDIVH